MGVMKEITTVTVGYIPEKPQLKKTLFPFENIVNT